MCLVTYLSLPLPPPPLITQHCIFSCLPPILSLSHDLTHPSPALQKEDVPWAAVGA